MPRGVVLMSEYLHEQTGLTAGTIADDDELASNLGHLCRKLAADDDLKERTDGQSGGVG